MYEEEAIETEAAPVVEATPPLGPDSEAIQTGDGAPSFENGVPMPRERTGPPSTFQNMVSIASEGGVGDQGPLKRIVSYLMGDDAAPPEAVNAMGAQVDPDGKMSPSDRNVLAIEKAAKDAGPEAAWKLVQSNRVAFNAKQAFGYAALTGTPKKMPDIVAAVDAANQAQSHILDGSDVQFAAGPQGVTATVRGDGGAPQQINLTPEQFKRYLNVGGDGQFDKLMQGGVPATLQKIAAAPGGPERSAQSRPPGAIDTREPIADAPRPRSNIGDTPSSLNLSGDDRPRPTQDETGYSPALQQRAQRIFPYASQAQQAEAWMAQQASLESEQKNRVQVARETGASRVAAADTRAQGGVQAQQVKNEGGANVQALKNQGWQYASDAKVRAAEAHEVGKAARQADANNNAAQSRALKLIQTKMLSLQELTPEEKSLAERIARPGAPPSTGPAPQQQAAPAAAGATAPQGKPPVPGAKQYKGQWYTRGPNGESVPVQ